MKTLLYKEWITQKKIISLCGMFIILFCGVINGFLNKEQYFYIGSQFLYGFSLVFCRLQVFLYNINMENKSKIYMIIKSIPTTPKEVVISKYIFSILCFFIYVVSTLVVIALLRVLSINVPSISFSTLGISLSIFILLISLYVPVFFKALEKNFGYFNVSFIFILVLGYNFVFKKLEENYGMQNVVSSIANNMLLVSSLILVISLIVFYMSYKISISFYRNREEI